MGRKSSKTALANAMFAATRALEEPVVLGEAPETFRLIYDSALADCRKEASLFGLGDDSFLDNRIRGRLHAILLAPDTTEAMRLAKRVREAVEVHVLLVAHRAGKLQRADAVVVEEA
jgi:hypothetical protein